MQVLPLYASVQKSLIVPHVQYKCLHTDIQGVLIHGLNQAILAHLQSMSSINIDIDWTIMLNNPRVRYWRQFQCED